MGCAEVISLTEVRASSQWQRLRDDLHARFDQVGLEPSVLTHWVTTTDFLGFRPVPRSRASLGATTTLSI